MPDAETSVEAIQEQLQKATESSPAQKPREPDNRGAAGMVEEQTREAQPEQVVLKIDGQERRMTLDEVKAEAQKQLAGQDRFAEYNKLRQDDARKIQMASDMIAAQTGDQAAIMRLSEYKELNISPEMAEQAVQAHQDRQAGKPEPTEQRTEGQISVEDVAWEVDQLKGKQQGQDQKQALVQVTGYAKSALEQDPIVGYLSDEKPKAFKQLTQYAVSSVYRQVYQEGQTLSPDVLRKAVQETRTYAEGFGLVGEDGELSTSAPDLSGLGRSPSALAMGKIARQKEPPKPIDNVLDSGDYAKNIHERLVHKLTRKARGG